MFITLTQLQNREATILQSPVDNTGGKLYVALQSFHYEIGYRNTSSSPGILWHARNSDNPKKIMVPPGLYTFEQLSDFLMEEIPTLTLKLTKATGLIRLRLSGSG